MEARLRVTVSARALDTEHDRLSEININWTER